MGMWSNICPPQPSLGRIGLSCFTLGMTNLCNKCSSLGHFASSCPEMTCSLYQGLGHLAKDCNRIKYKLCDKFWHAYSQCPEAFHNQSALLEEFFCLDMEKAEERGGLFQGSPMSLSLLSQCNQCLMVDPMLCYPLVSCPPCLCPWMLSLIFLCQSPQR